MVRAMKVMSSGLPGGVSFMEDYTYHLDDDGRPEPRGAHARGLRVDRRRAATTRGPPALDRRQGRSRPAGLRRPSGHGRPRLDRRHGPAVPDGHDRGGRHRPGAAAAQAAGRARPVATPPGPQDECDRMDPCRRIASHEPGLRGDAGASAPISRRCPGSSSCSSTSTPRSIDSGTSSAGTISTTSSRAASERRSERLFHAGRTGISSHGPARDHSRVEPADPCHRGRSRRRRGT